MGHARELLDAVTRDVARDYPQAEGYQYVFELAVAGTRMCPDIVVAREGRIVCAVEIGYTRPEKLTAYRDALHIPDVRWYDKEGRLHDHKLKKLIVEKKVVKLDVKAAPNDEVSVYHAWDKVPCIDCPALDPRRIPDKCWDRFIQRFGESAAYNYDQAADDEEYDYVYTFVVTDHVSIWLPTNCDKCGRCWLSDPDDEGFQLGDLLDDHPREVGLVLGARTRVSWLEAAASVQEGFGLSLDYMNGYLLHSAKARLPLELQAEISHGR